MGQDVVIDAGGSSQPSQVIDATKDHTDSNQMAPKRRQQMGLAMRKHFRGLITEEQKKMRHSK